MSNRKNLLYISRINVQLHGDSQHVCDFWGEAYYFAEQYQEAIIMNKMSLKIEKGNTIASMMIQKIKNTLKS
jgi:hypothetical protein